MAKLIIPANTILGDEKAWSYSEIHEQSPSSRGFHRYKVIKVLRGDKIADYREDMGLAKKYKGINPFTIPSFWLHTVDELMDIADNLRGQPRIDIKDLLQLDNFNLV